MQRLRHAIDGNPLTCLALAAISGIVTMDVLELAAWGTACWVAALALVLWTCWRPRLWSLVLAAATAFAFFQSSELDATRHHPLQALLQPGTKVDVVARGTFTSAPMGEETSKTPGRREACFQATSLVLPTRESEVQGVTNLRVWLKDPAFVPTGGEYELEGSLGLPLPAANPSLYDPQRGTQRRGIVAELSPRILKPSGPAVFSLRLWLLTVAERSRQWIRQAVTQGIEDDELARPLTQTMALGLSEAGSDQLQQPFRDTGTIHVFAISGLHVALLAGILMEFLRALRVSRRKAVLILIPLVLGYAFITGWRAAAARASMAAAAGMAAYVFDRRPSPVNVLGGIALVLLGHDPQQVFLPGFQLSFGVVFVLCVTMRPISHLLEGMVGLDPFLPPNLADWRQQLGSWCRRTLVEGVLLSVVAWAASLPFMLTEFHEMTPVSIVANLVLVPLAYCSLLNVVMSVASARFGLVALQGCFNNASLLLAHVLMGCATFFAAIPGGHFVVPMPRSAPPPPVSISILALSPGEGAQLVESQGRCWLLDCGGAKHEAAGVLSFLSEQGINSLDGVMLSHADSEHVGAMQDLMPRLHPHQVMTSLHEPWRLDSRVTVMRRLFDSHALDAALITRLQAGDAFDMGAARVHVLYPTAADLYNKADDRALVARIDCGRMRLLWCDDAGFITEKHLLTRFTPAELHSDVIIRNQHASDFSALPEFVLAVAPRLVVTSNAPALAPQRMPEHLVKLCQSRGIALFDQSRTGMVKLEVWPDHIEARSWLTHETLSISP